MQWRGHLNQQSTCAQWATTAKPTSGISHQATKLPNSKLPYCNTKQTTRYLTCLGRIYRRNGFRFAMLTSCRCSDCDILIWLTPAFEDSLFRLIDYSGSKNKIQFIKPWVIKWFTLYLFFMSGIKMTFVLLRPTCLRVYRYLICMADFVFSSSAASLINLADYTSALAEIILLSANLLSLAALDRESCRSLLSCISFMNIS